VKAVLVIGLVLLVAITIWWVGYRRTPNSAFWSGVVLVVSGLAASLLVPLHFVRDSGLPEYSYLSNTFLIVAAVGANFVAGSVLAGLQPPKSAPENRNS